MMGDPTSDAEKTNVAESIAGTCAEKMGSG